MKSPTTAKLKKQRVRAHLKSWKESHLSVINYCKQHKLAESTFYGWIKRYATAVENKFALVSPRTQNADVNTQTTVKGQRVKINLPQGITLDIDNVTNVTQLIKALTSWN